ncbi:MAG: winged helix-turn-helix domain-containing protein [Bryobacterales bacterium]|nr:winged helix-turn-helix domain-containing protein [Bryobacterales bacterium]
MIHRFGPFHYDSDQRLLFREAERVPLGPKAIDTLHVLLDRRGEVVDKADLMRLVWPDTTVEDVGLARNISLLRKAIGDESADPPWIDTVPRRGYRFAPDAEPQPEAAPQRSHARRRWPWLAALAAAVLAGLLYYQFYVPSRYLPPRQGASLAVVPFTCLCEAGTPPAGLADGLTDLLVAGLAQSGGGLHVVAPSTVRRHQKVGVSMGLMGRLLGLDALVEGTVQPLGGRLRITARLVDVHTGRVIWAGSGDHSSGDPATAQAAAARKTVSAIASALQGSRRTSE